MGFDYTAIGWDSFPPWNSRTDNWILGLAIRLKLNQHLVVKLKHRKTHTHCLRAFSIERKINPLEMQNIPSGVSGENIA